MNVLLIVICPFVHFLLAIVLSVLLRYTDSDCPYGIFKLILGLWCLSPLSIIFQLYRGGQLYWWRKPPTFRKSLTHIMLHEYTSPWTGFEPTTFVVTYCVVVNPTTIRSRPRQPIITWHGENNNYFVLIHLYIQNDATIRSYHYR
jgi:hypothetical protein